MTQNNQLWFKVSLELERQQNN